MSLVYIFPHSYRDRRVSTTFHIKANSINLENSHAFGGSGISISRSQFPQNDSLNIISSHYLHLVN